MVKIHGFKWPALADEIITGNVRFVDSGGSNTLDDPNHGGTPDKTFATWDYAIGQMTADNGDHLILLPKHAENIASAGAVTQDVAGLTSIGLGHAAQRPKFTYTATGSTLLISALDVKIANVHLYGNINDLAIMVDVDEGGFHLANSYLSTCDAKECINFVNLKTTYDDFAFTGCEFYQVSDPAGTDAAVNTGAIYLVDTCDVLIKDCSFHGFFETAILHNKTTKCQRVRIVDTELSNSIVVPIILVANSTGVMSGCYGQSLAATDATEALVYGTLDAHFFVCNSQLANDGGGGGFNGVAATACS